MQVLVTTTHLTDIANAIRAKNHMTARYKPGEMAAAILALRESGSSGGGSSGAGGIVGGSAGDAPPGRVRVGGFALAAKGDGSLAGYAAGKVMMALPNHQIIKFRAVLFCPTGILPDSMSVSDFTNGRAWSDANAYCSTPTSAETQGGTNYVMEWEELVDVTQDSDYIDDDDKSNDKLTYYCCSETKVKAAAGGTAAALSGARLTVDVFA